MGALDGLVALITGAGRQRGIGRATALRLARDGADLVISAKPRHQGAFPAHERASGWCGAESVAAEVRALGRRALAVDCDVTRRDQVESMLARTIAEFGRVDALVNNAGSPSEAGNAALVDMDDKLWFDTVDVNLNGVYLVSKHAARVMIKSGHGGCIVNVSSIAGRMGFANYGAYCATKFGVIGLTQQMALELAQHRIRVNAICPGSTETDMMTGTFQRTAEHLGVDVGRVLSTAKRGIPLGRQGAPEEQAAAIAFLIGPDASFVTGQTLNIDGGARMD
jgi:3-oxoacyl-[acyl-carrier protein] reductase/meso-butanediol dehydrogenase/(S,S)-butanediol dehydrogenase/diacetyl reductase